MKKKLVLVFVGTVAIIVLGLGIFNSSPSQAEPGMSVYEIKEVVLTQYPGEITDVVQGTEFNRPVYEIEIAGDERAYDLKLDGDTGEVLDITEKELNDSSHLVLEEKENTSENSKGNESNDKKKAGSEKKEIAKKNEKEKSKDPKNNSKYKGIISPEEAIEIALDEFPGKVDDIELDKEDGRLIYEIEIERNDMEADLEIDAYTGEIIVIEIEED